LLRGRYCRVSDGVPSVVLLPGNMCDGRLWEGNGGVLLRVLEAAGWPVRRPALDAGSITAMAEAVLEEFPGPILPIGFSMGGIVALELARLAPTRLIGLGLLGTNMAADLPERAAVRPRQQAAVRAGKLEEIVVGELKPNYLGAANRNNQSLLQLLRDMALKLGPQVFVRQSEALRLRLDLSDVLPRLAVPVFIACGAEDRLCPPEWHRNMAAAASNAELHVIPGSGHMLPLEQPDELAARLSPWLKHIEGRMND